jgi:O-antigen/teichoic acid export membrane protein
MALKKIVKDSTRLIFMLSLPALIILGVFASFFLNFFGSQYVIAKWPLIILLLGQLVNTMCGPVAIYMNMTGRQHKLQQILLLGFLVNLILNWFVIPVYGMIGAAVATAVSMALWNAIAVIYTYRQDKIKTFLS